MQLKQIIAVSLFLFLFFQVAAQGTLISGTVTDGNTGEALIGANVVYGPTQGTVTDLEGKFSLSLSPGSYTFNISYVGYETAIRNITVEGKAIILDIKLESMTIDEVVITADMAISRKTPVAFSNVNPAQIQEELAGQDLPMILNTTPGVYATQQGGGDGDARITIRGFDQTNLAVMIDGIPVNDMENGWVYWSNWFGLDAVTRTMQVQRGLGASQLALPSVGGTINILTKGIENKRETSIKQSIDSEGKLQTSLGYTSGKMRNGWGLTLAAAYKEGQGWVDNTYSKGWFYYLKVDKRLKKHLITFTGMGAPQMHDQRTYKKPITAFDTTYAKELGVDIEALKDYDQNYGIYNLGPQYNPFWGMLARNKDNPDADTLPLSARSNQYHKPQFVLRDFWTISDKLTLSSNFYVSLGKGGGDSPSETIKVSRLITDPTDPYYGQINWQNIYEENYKGSPPFYQPPISPEYSTELTVPNIYMERRHNDHYWYGLLSKLNYRLNNAISLSGGLDLRSYRGVHYTTVTDMLGGDYVIDKNDQRLDPTDLSQQMKFVGDTINYYYEGLVRWAGYYAQLEYSKNKLSSFLNLTSAVSGYKKVDYFADSESDWRYQPGFTVKTGGNYNISSSSNIFLNLGYLSRVKAYKYFYMGYTTDFIDTVENEKVKSIELGYNYASPRFSLFFNTYYTRWENRPTSDIRSKYTLQPGDPYYNPDDPDSNEERDVYAIIPGLDARHMGMELDFAYKIIHNLELQGTVSIGDWIWDSYIEDVQFYLDEGSNPAVQKVIDIDTRGIHVSDAAQVQLGTSLRYKPVKGLYLNLRQTYFTKFYSRFEAESTTDEAGNVQDSWKMPAFNLWDFHAGYNFKLPFSERLSYNVRFSMLNVLDRTYIWGAENNDTYGPYSNLAGFDATSATVFFGLGRRFVASLNIKF